MAANREFFNRRLHSLLGVIPVGVFLFVHLTVNYQATKGVEAYNKAAEFMGNLPYVLFLEIFVIFLPLLFHAIYGIYIAFTAKNNVHQYGWFRNWMFLLQRLTGIITLIYVVWHVWNTTIQAKFFNAEVNFDMMANIVDNPVTLTLYIIGIVSAVFHLSNGLWSFCVSWGLTVSPKSQRVFTWITMAIFVAMSYVGVTAILAFA
ncbi:MAG: succinate dehydrogenase cytochrome b558 subunit [Bacillales bacterium]